MHKILKAFVIILIPFCSRAQGILSDDTINIVGLWKLDEVKSIHIEKTRSQNGEGVNGEVFKLTYDIGIRVIDSTSSYYELEWIYQNFKLESEINSADLILYQMMRKNEGLKIRYRTDIYGTFDRITNWPFLRVFLNEKYTYHKKYAELQSGEYGQYYMQLVNQLEPIYTNQQSFENSHLLKDIQQYHYLNGISLQFDEQIISEIEQPNPMTGVAFPLDLVMKFESFNSDIGFGIIQVDQKYNSESKAILLESTKIMMKNAGMPIPEDARIPVIDISESYTFKYNLDDGWPITIEYSKTNDNMYFKRIDLTSIKTN